MDPIPSSDLLRVLQLKAGEALDQDTVDVLLAETMAWLLAGPARCRTDIHVWDDLPPEAQGILLAVLTRQATGGGSNVVQERVGDYSVKYSDPSLFEGKLPSYLFPDEELALSRIFGCGGDLRSVTTGGIPIKDMSTGTERLLYKKDVDGRRLGAGY